MGKQADVRKDNSQEKISKQKINMKMNKAFDYISHWGNAE